MKITNYYFLQNFQTNTPYFYILKRREKQAKTARKESQKAEFQSKFHTQ
jgi:hypothetical protein